jgi:hypothetical protein
MARPLVGKAIDEAIDEAIGKTVDNAAAIGMQDASSGRIPCNNS